MGRALITMVETEQVEDAAMEDNGVEG